MPDRGRILKKCRKHAKNRNFTRNSLTFNFLKDIIGKRAQRMQSKVRAYERKIAAGPRAKRRRNQEVNWNANI